MRGSPISSEVGKKNIFLFQMDERDEKLQEKEMTEQGGSRRVEKFTKLPHISLSKLNLGIADNTVGKRPGVMNELSTISF